MKLKDNGLREILDLQPLSAALRKAHVVAHDTGDKNFVQWVRLELGGYSGSNSAMNDDVVVPEYRTVSGNHYDLLQRRYVVAPELAFVNEMRLRNGVEELEALINKGDTATLHDPTLCELINKNLKVDVYAFQFSTVQLCGVLAAIRNELEQKILALEPVALQSVPQPKPSKDVIQLKPTFYGMSVDLKALWRRWQSRGK